ncbi:MAG TPA: peptidase M61, partial [Terriglobia bacterium]|nr:peptidase M61 [Terriglobia bacterium]
MRHVSISLCGLLFLTGLTFAQGPRSAPQPAPMPPPIVAPRDVPYPGVMRVDVDATDLERRIYRIRQSIPVVAAGPMVLLYPRWIPGTH